MFSCLFSTENIGNYVLYNNKQYIYGMNIPISISTFSISIFFLVWFFWITISELYGCQHWEDKLWLSQYHELYLKSKFPSYPSVLVLRRASSLNLDSSLTLKWCIFCSDNMRRRSHFLAFFPCEWKEAIWYAEYSAKAFNWKAEQKVYGTA